MMDAKVSEYFSENDEFLFELSSINFWLRVNFTLAIAPDRSNAVVEGSTEIRIDWDEKMS